MNDIFRGGKKRMRKTIASLLACVVLFCASASFAEPAASGGVLSW